MILVSAVNGWLFSIGCRDLDDKAGVYTFSLAFDFMMILAYYVVPIAIFGVRLSPGVILGSLIMLAGLAVVKVS
jgi:hypothetical protein